MNNVTEEPQPCGKRQSLCLRQYLGERVIGQDAVSDAVCSAFDRGELGVLPAGQLRGSFLFLGPTGVGKTEMAKTCAEFLFGKEGLAIFDMSEFQGPDAIRQMIGSSRDRGRFHQRVERMNSRGVILFDEIEKADRNILDLFLQILDSGRLTLASGVQMDLSGFYVVMTSNIASQAILKAQGGSPTAMQRFVETQAEKYLRPELYGRIDEVQVFRPLDFKDRVAIGKRLLEREVERVRNLGFEVDQFASDSIVALCAGDCRLGIRPLKRRIEKFLYDNVARGRGEAA